MSRDYFGNYPIVAGLGFSRDVLLLDDCEGTMTWIIGGDGGDDLHEFAAAAAWQGTYGMHLKTRTTGTTEDDETLAEKLFDYPATNLLVARLRVTPVVVANTKSAGLYLRAGDGAEQYQGAILLNIAAGTVTYIDSAGAAVEIPALATTFIGENWYTLELAIDLQAHTYLHVRFNGLEADLSTVALRDLGASGARDGYLLLAATASAAGPGEIYADNIVVHQIPEA